MGDRSCWVFTLFHYSTTPFSDMTLHIRAIMNSAVEEIFGFKTCCSVRVFDQNLEFLITNKGKRLIRVPSYCDVEETSGFHRVDTLIPHGEQPVGPSPFTARWTKNDGKEYDRSCSMTRTAITTPRRCDTKIFPPRSISWTSV
jgi:hypothetical protein